MDSAVEALAHRVGEAAQDGRPLRIVGHGSKDFYGNASAGEALSTRELTGVVAYEPGELYVAAAAAEPLEAVEKLLGERGQMLPFDPPRYGGKGTVGGAMACGLAGPGKPRGGGVRDSILGVRLVNGRGDILNFGGRVMKNVAGYDVSRLNVGALGGLGVIAEAVFKVSPKPRESQTLMLELDGEKAVAAVADFLCRSLPVSATFHDGRRLFLRLSSVNDVGWARRQIGGDETDGDDFWEQIRDHHHPFFKDSARSLWRISAPAGSRSAAVFADEMRGKDAAFEWHGGVYWLRGGDAAVRRRQAGEAGGYACLFRRGLGESADIPFLSPPPPPLFRLHQRLKKSFDPSGILNPGRLYPGC